MRPNSTVISGETRRTFLKTAAVAGTGLGLGGFDKMATSLAQSALSPVAKTMIRLGFDNFSVRAMGWKADALIDYGASLRLDSILISDLDAFESFEEAYLKKVGARAEEMGMKIHAGTWSICPTSKTFKNKWGTAEEHLALGIRVAKALGSPVLRCVLGSGEDRKTEGGIEARIADTVKVCKACRSQAMDAGIKIAVENHAGDMQAWELVTLIEAAGKDYVGVNLDSGNAAWTMEDPLASFETLAPYVVTTSLRDSMLWPYEEGVKVQWTAMGEGLVDWKTYFQKFAVLCPKVPVNIETISGFSRPFPLYQPDYWKVWPKARASDLARFMALARRGKALENHKSPDNKAEQDYQKAELERSLKYCKEVLALGLK